MTDYAEHFIRLFHDELGDPLPTDPGEWALFAARRRTSYPRRDEALLRFLYDTGVRASEVIAIDCGAVNLNERSVTVLGKGGKRRTVAYGGRTAKALWSYLREGRDAAVPLFLGQRGRLTRSGLLQLVERIGELADVPHVHPHRFRHTFAVDFLRAGGNTFALQQILGHTHLAMTQRYVAYAEADVRAAQRRHSPGDRL